MRGTRLFHNVAAGLLLGRCFFFAAHAAHADGATVAGLQCGFIRVSQHFYHPERGNILNIHVGILLKEREPSSCSPDPSY